MNTLEEPQWANFNDLHENIVEIIRNTTELSTTNKEIRRWTQPLMDKHETMFESWTYINKKDLAIEILSAARRQKEKAE